MRKVHPVTPGYGAKIKRSFLTLAAAATVYSVSTSLIEQDQVSLQKPARNDHRHTRESADGIEVPSNFLVRHSELFSYDELEEMAQLKETGKYNGSDKRLLTFYRQANQLQTVSSEQEKAQTLRRICLQLVYADIYDVLDDTWKLFSLKAFIRFIQLHPEEFNFADPQVKQLAETLIADSLGITPPILGRNFLVVKLNQAKLMPTTPSPLRVKPAI